MFSCRIRPQDIFPCQDDSSTVQSCRAFPEGTLIGSRVVSDSRRQTLVDHMYSRLRHESEASSCAGREEVLKIRAFHRLICRHTLGELTLSPGAVGTILMEKAVKTRC